MAQRPTKSNEQRLDEVEEAFMLFAALIGGEPSDATAEEKNVVALRFASLMESIRSRHS